MWDRLGAQGREPVPHAPLLPAAVPGDARSRAPRGGTGPSRPSARCASARSTAAPDRSPAAAATRTTDFVALTARRPVVEAALEPDGQRDRRCRRSGGVSRSTPCSPVTPAVAGIPHVDRRRAPMPARRSRPTSSSTRPVAVEPSGTGSRRSVPAGRRGARGLRVRVLRPSLPLGRRQCAAEPRSAAPALRLGVGAHPPRRQRHWGLGIIVSAQRHPDARAPRRRAAGRRPGAASRSSPTGSTASRSATAWRSWRRSRTVTGRSCIDGEPVATGVVAVGDAWACTNPSVGRGSTIGLLHAVALRDLLRDRAATIPSTFAAGVARRDAWRRSSRGTGRRSATTGTASVRSRPCARRRRTRPTTRRTRSPRRSSSGRCSDPGPAARLPRRRGDDACPRRRSPRPGVFEKVLADRRPWRDAEVPAPDRAGLLELVGA